MINLAELNKVTKIPFGRPDDCEWVDVRVMVPGVMSEITKKYEENKREFQVVDGQPVVFKWVETSPENDDLVNTEIWDYCIVDWNIKDENNEKIPVTKENKRMLMTQSSAFSKCVMAALKGIRAAEAKEQEKVEKNS